MSSTRLPSPILEGHPSIPSTSSSSSPSPISPIPSLSPLLIQTPAPSAFSYPGSTAPIIATISNEAPSNTIAFPTSNLDSNPNPSATTLPEININGRRRRTSSDSFDSGIQALHTGPSSNPATTTSSRSSFARSEREEPSPRKRVRIEEGPIHFQDKTEGKESERVEMNGHDEMDDLDVPGPPHGDPIGATSTTSNILNSVRRITFDSEYMYPPPSSSSSSSSSGLTSSPFPTTINPATSTSHSTSSSTTQQPIPTPNRDPRSQSFFTTPPRPGNGVLDGTANGNGKGKGKAREMNGIDMGGLENMVSSGGSVGHDGVGIGGIKREEFVRVVLQALRDVGYDQTAQTLQLESGYEQEPLLITTFKSAILGGRWSESVKILEELGVVKEGDKKKVVGRRGSSASMRGGGGGGGGQGQAGMGGGLGMGLGAGMLGENGAGSGSMMASSSAPTTSSLGSLMRKPSSDEMQIDSTPSGSTTSRKPPRTDAQTKDSPGRQAILMILEQKYLELLEANQTKRALAVLRTEIAPLAAQTERLHTLSGFIMCLDNKDLYARAGWDGVGGRSRELLLRNLQAFLRPGMMIPPRRLATLFDQARKHQELHCLYHTSNSQTSLLADHQCRRNDFPTVSTHILADHEDEVWVIEWSHDGQYIASGGKDSNVIIWKIGPAPARNCEKLMTLNSTAEDVTSISWSPDDSRLLVAADTNLYLWDTKSGTQVCTLSNLHKDVISAVQWLPGKGGFASAGMDMKLMFWTWEGTLNRTWPTVPLRIHDFVITPDGKRVIAIAVLNEVKADGRGQKPVASRSPDRVVPDGLGLGGQPVTIGKMDRHIVIYDYETGKIVGHSRRNVPAELTSISLSKDCKSILLSCSPDELQLWSIENDTLTFVRKYTGHRHRHFHLRSCFGGRDRNFIVSGSEDSLVYVWHSDTSALLEVLEGHSLAVNSVAWNPVYPDIFASCSDDKTIRIWQPPSVADAIAEDGLSSATRHPTSWANGGRLPTIIPVSPMPHEMDLVY